MLPFGQRPGYEASPADVFGPQVDFEFWDNILAAGNGPTARSRYSAIAGLRAITSAMSDVSIQRLPGASSQTVMREQYTSNTGLFIPGS